MKDIYDKLNKYLKDTQKYGDLEDFKLVHRGQILSSSNSLTQAGIKEGVNLDVILQMKVNPENLVS